MRGKNDGSKRWAFVEGKYQYVPFDYPHVPLHARRMRWFGWFRRAGK